MAAGKGTMTAMNTQTPTIRRPATYQDVLEAPPNMVAELIRGALHLQPRPASPHALAGSSLGYVTSNSLNVTITP